MKKRLWIFTASLIAAAFFILPAKKVDAQAKFGIKGGINFSNMKYEAKDQTSGVPDANSLISYHVGIIADIPIVNMLSVQPGVMLNSIGSKVEREDATLGKYTEKVNPVYIDVPVNILFKPSIGGSTKFYIGAGPYIGYGIGGKVSYSAETPLGDAYTDHDIKYGNDTKDDLKAIDIGGNVLAGFEFDNGLLIGAQYGLSFTNNAPNGDNDAPKILRNKVLSASLGFLF